MSFFNSSAVFVGVEATSRTGVLRLVHSILVSRFATDAALGVADLGQAPEVDVQEDRLLNRGQDSPGVLNQLLAVSQQCKLVPLMGNH